MMVLAATNWVSNTDLILSVKQLGYLKDDWVTLDPTYGRGSWWKKWEPEKLHKHDLKTGVNFCDLPYPDNFFDAAVFDPPYVSVGGRTTSGLPDFLDHYGLVDAPKSPAELQQLINDGLTEVVRVVKPKGFVLVKCCDYVSSGKLWSGTLHTSNHGLSLGCELFDRLEHVVASPRPQPMRRRQVHARRNLSTLLVFKV